MTAGLTSSAGRAPVWGGTHLPRTGVCCLPTVLPWILGGGTTGTRGSSSQALPKLWQGTQTEEPEEGTALPAGTPTATPGAQGWGAAPWDVGMWLSIFSPGPTGRSLLAPGQRSTSVWFSCKDRNNPADFLGAAHTLKDWWILEEVLSIKQEQVLRGWA